MGKKMTKNESLKPALTFDEQVEKLKSKNITIVDSALCKEFLNKVNYYRFSAYYLPFYNAETGLCFEGTDFERLKKIYEFDQELRAFLFEIIEDIEIYIRTQMAYYHAHLYGPEGYMDACNFNHKHDHQKFKRHIENCKRDNKKTLVIDHHNKKYGGHVPIWAMVEFFSIGELAYFYLGMKTSDKKAIASSLYGVTYDTLESWMRCLTDLRNKCAHYTRLYYWKFSALPKIPTAIKYTPTRRLYAQIYMLKLMYPYSEKWNERYVKKLYRIIQKYRPFISLKHLDFPYRWKFMLIIK